MTTDGGVLKARAMDGIGIDRSLRHAGRLGVLACVTAVAAWACTALTHETGRIASIWAANAVVVAVLLRTPPSRWAAYLLAGLGGDIVGNLLSGDGLALALGFAVCNGSEILLCAVGMRRIYPSGEIDLTRPRTLLTFCLLAAASPVIAAGLAAGLMAWMLGAAPLAVIGTWYPADLLGLLIIVPLLVSVKANDLRALMGVEKRRQVLLGSAAMAAALVVTFGQREYPLLFLVFPALAFIAFRLGFAGVVVALSMTATAALWSILARTGPLATIDGSLREQVVVLQVFLVLTTLTSLQISAVLTARRRLTDALEAAKASAETARSALAVSEARYRTLIDSLPQKVWLAQPDGTPTFINGAMTTGLCEVELEPLMCVKIVHPDDLPAFMAAKGAALTDGDGFEIEARLLDRSDAYRWHRLSIKPLHDRHGAVAEWVGAALDIDDLRRTQDELIVARDRAEAAGRAKADFLANMSHELRTPLTAVIGASELLLSGYGANDPAKQRRYLEMQRDAGTGLLEIINDILDFSKIEAGQMELETVSFVLADVVGACREVVAEQAARKSLHLTVSIAAALPTRVLGDPTRVRQVLLNLLSNAVKFTPTGGTVHVAVEPTLYEPERVRFSVRDTGIGIAPERLSQLFERFTQAENSTSRRFGGSGLGLAICRRLVDAMGGTFTVDSQPGAGSVFAFSLILREDRVVPLRPAAAEPVMPSTPHRLLLAEDSPMNQQIVGAMLRQAGHEVVLVGDGAQAIAAARQATFDLILMDVQMPGVDGYEATRTIRRSGIASPQGGPVPIIALTANALSDEPDRCRAAGMDAHMPKPVDWPALFALIEGLTKPIQVGPDRRYADGALAL